MDERMKQIATEAFYACPSGPHISALYAACEAVLAASAQGEAQQDVAKASWDVWNMTGRDSTQWDELDESDKMRWFAALAAARAKAQP